MSEWFYWWVDPTAFCPRTECGDWGHWVLDDMFFISQLVYAGSYIFIALMLRFLHNTYRDILPVKHVMFLFGSFILFCGIHHVFEALAMVLPLYRLQAVMDSVGAMFSMFTAAYLYVNFDRLNRLVPREQYAAEVEKRKLAESGYDRIMGLKDRIVTLLNEPVDKDSSGVYDELTAKLERLLKEMESHE